VKGPPPMREEAYEGEERGGTARPIPNRVLSPSSTQVLVFRRM
jgi:hypothetical protein